MTRFERSGHWRTSKYGNRHWVSGGDVFRDDWGRGSSYFVPPPRPDPFFERYPEMKTLRRVTACFVNPNATCPVCGARVFYYQNEHGSRVFFDELGPPWPKHPCTDSRAALPPGRSRAAVATTVEPRSSAALAEIASWREKSGPDFVALFKAKYGSSPWQLAKLTKRQTSGRRVFLVLDLLQPGRTRRIYASCKRLPKSCVPGTLVAVRRQKISFFDLATMASQDVVITRYRGASAFVDAMIEPEDGKS